MYRYRNNKGVTRYFIQFTQLVIKKLKNNAEEIGTMKLSIPKTLNCSSKVAIKAIVK